MKNRIDLEKQLCIINKATIDEFLKSDKPSDLISLYLFYYYTAKWQSTNQPYVTISFVCKALGWGHNRVRDAKRKLVEMGLIEDVRRTGEDGKTTGWYIRIRYFWSRDTENHPTHNREGGDSAKQAKNAKSFSVNSEKTTHESTLPKNHRVENREVNALSANNKMLNTLARVVVSDSVRDRDLYPVVNKFKKKTGDEEMKRILAGCITRDVKFQSASDLARYLQGAVNKRNGHDKKTKLGRLDGKVIDEDERKRKIERAKAFQRQKY